MAMRGSLTGGAGSESRPSQIPVKGMSVARIWEIIHEHGAQLKRLRSEHETLKSEHYTLIAEGQAMRRCLDEAGVVPRLKFEEELRSCAASSSSRSSSIAGAGTGGTEASTEAGELSTSSSSSSLASKLGAMGAPGAGSMGNSQRRLPAAAKDVGDGPAQSAQASQIPRNSRLGGTTKRASSSGAVTAAGPPSTSAGSGNSANGGAAPGSSVSARRPSMADRDRTPTRLRRSSSADGQAAAAVSSSAAPGSRGRSASGSPRRATVKPTVQPAKDLYELAQPLLQPNSSVDQQNAALASVVQALKGGATPNKWNGPGQPLKNAVQAHRVDLARALLQAKADPNESDQKGVSVLHTASFDGQAEICKLLLDFKADANQADRHGQTPLFFAPVRTVCEVLFLKRADVNSMNQKGQSALHLAGRAGLGEVLAWLAGKVSKPLLELRDTHGATAAYYARHAGVQTDVLIRTKLVSFEPPPPPAGRSALVEGVVKVGSSAGASEERRPRRGSERRHSGGNGELEPNWLAAGPLGGMDGGRLPPLPEDRFSDENDEDETEEQIEVNDMFDEDELEAESTSLPGTSSFGLDDVQVSEVAAESDASTVAPPAISAAGGRADPTNFVGAGRDMKANETSIVSHKSSVAPPAMPIADEKAAPTTFVNAERGKKDDESPSVPYASAADEDTVVAAPRPAVSSSTQPPQRPERVVAAPQSSPSKAVVAGAAGAGALSGEDLVTWDEDEGEDDEEDDDEEDLVDENGRCRKCGGDVDVSEGEEEEENEKELEIASPSVADDGEDDVNSVAGDAPPSDAGSVDSTARERRMEQRRRRPSVNQAGDDAVTEI